MLKNVMIVAGEASGDLHASNLIRAVHEISPDISFYGVCGKMMREAGAETLVESSSLSVVGIAEIIPSAGQILGTLRLLKRKLKEDRPSLLVLIDFPDFNLMLAAYAKKIGIPVLYYISPQVWAWRKGRAKKIARLVDRMAVAFPFETDLYKRHGLSADFVGHPLIDAVKVDRDKYVIRIELGIDEGKKVIGLMPGSRSKEINALLPPMLESAEIMASRSPEFEFILPLAHTVDRMLVDHYLSLYNVNVKVVEGMTYEVMHISDMAFIASGTATLEAAIIGTPMVVLYKASSLTYMIGRYLVLTNISWFSLPNIVAEREVVHELLQDEVNAGRMVEEAFAILFGKGVSETMKKDLNEVRERLGGGGASKRAANLLVEMVDI
ncbi:MAG: lipid-A-disaccharide synthase [bacterium]|nr:lipid-A-disaccharide synthase [bacterium]